MVPAAPLEIRNFYREEAECVTSPFTYQGQFDSGLMDRILSKLGVNLHGMRVLDVGCGRGLMRAYVEERGAKYVGVDLVANWKSNGHPRNSHFAIADAQRLPFRGGSFGAVFCIDSFEHFPDPFAAASEFRRLLQPGGFVFLSVPNYSNVAGLVKKASEASGRYAPNTWAPFGSWKPQALESMVTPSFVRQVFRAAGFRNFRMYGLGREVAIGLCPWVWHPLFPGRLANFVMRILEPVGNVLVSFAPSLSLHVFWAISG